LRIDCASDRFRLRLLAIQRLLDVQRELRRKARNLIRVRSIPDSVRIAVGIEYDGSAYCGWQTQPCGCSVQDAFEQALAAIAGTSVRSVCAGRTDAGVHALGQVVHFDVDVTRPLSAWVRGVNTFLPGGIAVTWAREVDATFHARYSASARTYRYLLLNRPERPGLFRGRVGWYHHALDLDTMRDAACSLVGEYDFSAFRSAECQARSAIRHMQTISIHREGPLVTMEFCANAFLHNMVRIIVGSLIEVGSGNRPVSWLAQVRDDRDRTRAARTADSAGLYLVGVNYDARWNLPPPPVSKSLHLQETLAPCR
jgi:tRNA pseudouridine38-40 synthase